MLRPKDKWPEFIAAAFGVAGLVLYYGLHNDTAAIVALIIGGLVLAWSYLDVTPR